MTSARDFARGVNPDHPAYCPPPKTFHLLWHDTSFLLKAGDVIRVFDDSAFGDAVILGFDERGYAKCSRPYVYASGVGTTGPTALLGSETIIYSPSELVRFKVVTTGRTTR